MNIHQESLKLLKIIYDLKGKPYSISRGDYNQLDIESKDTLLECIRYLEEENLITPYGRCVGLPISHKITSKGIRMIEQVPAPSAQSSNNFVFNGNVFGIVGNNVTGNTINQGCSLEEFKSLLESSISNKQEVEAIKTLLEPLFQRMENNEPLDKGILCNISDHLQKHEGLYTTLLTLIASYLSK